MALIAVEERSGYCSLSVGFGALFVGLVIVSGLVGAETGKLEKNIF